MTSELFRIARERPPSPFHLRSGVGPIARVLNAARGARACSSVFAEEGVPVARIVSMPYISEERPQSYHDGVPLRPMSARIAIEQGSMLGWERCVARQARSLHEGFGPVSAVFGVGAQIRFEPERMSIARGEMLQ